MTYASIFKAAKSTGYKFSVIIHPTPSIVDCFAEKHFQSKAECKAYVNSVGATRWNY